MTPYSAVFGYQHFRGTYRFHLQGKRLVRFVKSQKTTIQISSICSANLSSRVQTQWSLTSKWMYTFSGFISMCCSIFLLNHVIWNHRTEKNIVIKPISTFRKAAMLAAASHFSTACFALSSPTPPLCSWTTCNGERGILVLVPETAKRGGGHSLGKRNLNWREEGKNLTVPC
jgi:hypothetical protein